MPLWIIPLFPLFFVAVWLLVMTILATLGGWRALGRRYPDPGNAAVGDLQRLPGSSIRMTPVPVSYRGCVTLMLSSAGLHLRVMPIFRFLHPPLLIPWSEIERAEAGWGLFGRTLALHPRGGGTGILLHGITARRVEEAWAARAESAPPAPV